MKEVSEMDRKSLLQYVAPCSLLCYTCPALKDGAISQCASKLCRYFDGYYDFNVANIPEQYRAWLTEFKSFYQSLEQYTNRPCPGCRNNPHGAGCIDGCVVPPCVKEKGIDFCAECAEFPCQNAKNFFSTVNDTIGKDWENGNKRIAEVGIEKYFEERKELSHYISYKK